MPVLVIISCLCFYCENYHYDFSEERDVGIHYISSSESSIGALTAEIFCREYQNWKHTDWKCFTERLITEFVIDLPYDTYIFNLSFLLFTFFKDRADNRTPQLNYLPLTFVSSVPLVFWSRFISGGWWQHRTAEVTSNKMAVNCWKKGVSVI